MDPIALAEHVKTGNVRAVSRLITLLENQEPVGQAALERLNGSPRPAAVIGVTGYSGSGKSTLIDQLGTAYRRQGKKVGIVAVDTTSPRTGGALPWDQIRRQEHSKDGGGLLFSIATRGGWGGAGRGPHGAGRGVVAARLLH